MLGGVQGIPPRTATDVYLARAAVRLDVVFDVDLGELVDGHRVIARGIEMASSGAVLHYEFVPGMSETGRKDMFWYWTLSTADDAGTAYTDNNGGAFDPEGTAAGHGIRDLGGVVPVSAKRLLLRFEPAPGWTPPGPWCRRMEIDLVDGSVAVHR
jgi:hypothetical protein